MKSSKEDWTRSAIALLVSHGPQSLNIESLCKAMAKTKGSFYHHFEGVSGLHNAILDLWEESGTNQIIQQATDAPDAGEELSRLSILLSWDEERAIRQWALHSDKASERLEKVDRKRVAFMVGLYSCTSDALAKKLALIEYAAFVGAQHLSLIPDSAKERENMSHLLHQALQGLSKRLEEQGSDNSSPEISTLDPSSKDSDANNTH